MVIYMIVADVECYGEFVVSLKSKAFIVTRESSSLFIDLAGLSCQTPNLLLFVLAFAGDDHLGLARLVLLAWIWCMTGVKTQVTAARSSLLLTTRMWARRSSVLTFSRTVA